MKKYIALLLISFTLITSCQTNKVEYKIELPPRPQRQEIKEPSTLQDIAEIINYYDHLVREWEAWGDTVESLTESKK